MSETENVSYDEFLAEHLRLWKDTGKEAPRNELQSIAAWLRYLGEHGEKKTKNTMQARMILLMETVNQVHDAEAEDKVGIYDNAPEMRPEIGG